MADNINNRYGNNRNLWRKTYGYSQNKKQLTTVTNEITSQSYTIDLNSTFRHRDFFIIKGLETRSTESGPSVIPFGEYDEGLVFFNFSDSTEKSFNFNFTFSGTPFVTVQPEYENEYSNINVFGIEYSTTWAYIGISAPYSGNIRYRAIYSTTYPAYVTSAYTTSIMTASAGSATVINQDYYYSTFSTLPKIPTNFYETPWDSTDGTSNIDIENITTTTSYISSSLSSIYNKEIHFIVMTSGSIDTPGFMYTFGFNFGG